MKVKTFLEVRSPSSGSKRNFGFTRVPGVLCVTLWIALSATTSVRAGSMSSDQSASSSITESNRSASTRYGLFDWLDIVAHMVKASFLSRSWWMTQTWK